VRRVLALATFAVLTACGWQPEDDARVSPAPSSTARAAVCAASETPIFACSFADGKRVAVCGTEGGVAEYRFGGEDAIDFVLDGGQNATAMYSGGGESQLAFSSGATRYIVFSRIVRTGFDESGNDPAISDGVVVERGGEFLAIRVCDDPEVKPVDVDAAEAFLPVRVRAKLFTDETIRADTDSNE
jgi:hypothetical protein